MATPDNIPQDVWERAVDALSGDKPTIEIIALAMMTERERCASRAEYLSKLLEGIMGATPASALAASLAVWIRSGEA